MDHDSGRHMEILEGRPVLCFLSRKERDFICLEFSGMGIAAMAASIGVTPGNNFAGIHLYFATETAFIPDNTLEAMLYGGIKFEDLDTIRGCFR